MRLEALSISNFCRLYGDHHLDLQPGITFITSTNLDEPEQWESNAVGKTSLLHAISYALFGSTPNGLVGHELISHQCGPRDVMRCILDFSEGITVQRYYYAHRKRSVVTFTHPTMGVIEGDTGYVNSKIQEFFKVTPTLFNSSLFLSQRDSTSTQFLSAKPAERSRILSDLVDDRVWQKAAEFLAADAKECGQEFSAAGTKLAVHQRNLQSLESNLTRLTETLATAARVEDEKRASVQSRLKSLRDAIAKETAVEMDQPKADIAELEKQRVVTAKRIDTLQNSLKELPSIGPPLSMGVTCPTCQSTVAAETVERVICRRAEIQGQRDTIKKELTDLQKELTALQERQQRVRDWKSRTELAADRRARYKTEMAHLEEELTAPAVSLIALAQQETALKAEREQRRTEIQSLQKSAVELGERSQRLQKLATGFKSEMRNLLFDRIRTELENYTQTYLYNLAGKGLRVEYPSGEGVREKFDIVVYNGEQAQVLEAYSGGEYWRVTLAILLALRDVLVLKSGCTLPLLLVDDPVGPVDGIGLTNFLLALQGLIDTQNAGTMLITVPDASVATTGSVIHLERSGGLTRIV